MSSIEAPPLPESHAKPAPMKRWSRMSDRLNPILVREIQQAVKGRVFPVTIMLALGISVIIATVVSSEYVDGQTGRGAFDAGFATLIPLVLFIIPMQAYNSMRTELKGGIVEQLLLSRLSPSAVLSGKLQAAMVQFALYVSVLAPLLATSYLLRGVDLPTIAISLAFALVISIAATAFAVSSAAQAIVPALQPIANLGIAFGLGFGTVAMVSMVASGGYSSGIGYLLRSRDFGMVVSAIIGTAILATTLSWLAARTFLLHAFENKSTPFRVFLFLLPPLVYGWMLLFVPSGQWRYAFPALSVALAIAGIVFGVFMVTEQRAMSPRVFAHVPANSMRARFMTPFLPGRDRGMLCFAAYAALLVVICLLVGVFSPSRTFRIFRDDGITGGLMGLTYAFVYLGLGRFLRSRLPDTVQGNHGGRFILPLMLFLGCLVPALIDVVTRGEPGNWHVGHIMNPFWTINEFYNGGSGVITFCLVTMLAMVVVSAPAILRGVGEVREASAAHRLRLRPVAEPAPESAAGPDSQQAEPSQSGAGSEAAE